MCVRKSYSSLWYSRVIHNNNFKTYNIDSNTRVHSTKDTVVKFTFRIPFQLLLNKSDSTKRKKQDVLQLRHQDQVRARLDQKERNELQ